MSPKRKQIALARVLIALAWADGRISHEELNFLKDFLFKIDLTGEEWAQVEMYLEEPVSQEEAEALVRDFIQTIGGTSERERAAGLLEGMMQADGATSDEERALLERFKTILREATPATGIANLFRGLFRETMFKPVTGSKRSEELQDFINNRILFKVRRKLERDQLDLETHPDDLSYAAVFGGLLAHVATVHNPLGPNELEVLKGHLRELAGFGEEAVELIVSVIQESAAQGLDRFRLTREFYEKSTHAQRIQLLECLFDIAGSDTDLQHAEVEEVRAIARALKLSHGEFIDAKLKHLRGAR